MDSQVTVFVVDDDPAAMQSVVALLESHQFKCRGFGSALTFLDAYDPAEPGCLVTDLAMPGMTGLELYCELTARGWLIPTIVVSGYADVSQAVQLMRKGAVTVLEKPYHQSELLEATRRALECEVQLRIRAQKLVELNQQFSKLTEGERAVVDGLVGGQTNKAIAFELGVAVRTIEHRRQRIYEKLSVGSVAQLAISVAERDHLMNNPLNMATVTGSSATIQ